MVVKNKQTQALSKLELLAKTDAEASVRQYACWAIGEMNLISGIQTLRLKLNTDPSIEVRKAASRSIKKLEGQAAPPPKAETPVQPQAQPQLQPQIQPINQCREERDCALGLKCINNTCAKPGAEVKSKPEPVKTTGWALEASIIGFVGAAAVGGLSIAAAARKEDLLPAIPLAVGATLVTLVVAPSVKSGSKSARETEGVHGLLSLRVVGWLAFSVHIVGSLALGSLIPVYLVDESKGEDGSFPETSWIVANGMMGMVSIICLSVDTLVARNQAKRIIDASTAESKKGARLRLTPFVTPTYSPQGDAGTIFGFTGTF
jgi:hypothetical protein